MTIEQQISTLMSRLSDESAMKREAERIIFRQVLTHPISMSAAMKITAEELGSSNTKDIINVAHIIFDKLRRRGRNDP